MSENIEDLLKKLNSKLPEFNIKILGERILGAGLYNIQSGDKVAIELPEDKSELRITMLSELRKVTSLDFHSDSRSLDGVCLSVDDINNKNIKLLGAACDEGKLDNFNINYLNEIASAEDKLRSIHLKAGGSEIAKNIMIQAVTTNQKSPEQN